MSEPHKSLPVPRPTLQGSRVLLRQPRPSDKEERLKIGRSPELVKMYGGNYEHVSPLTQSGVEQWYARTSSDPLTWIIEAEGQCIGESRLHNLDKDNRSARYAVGIFNPAFWSRGFGTEATRLVLQYAFDELKLHRVDLRVLSYNERGIASFKKSGFVEEGRERDSALVAGEWQTDIRMSILEDEYRAVQGRQ